MIGNALATLTLPALDTIHGDLDMDASSDEFTDTTITKLSFPKLTKIEGAFRVGYSNALTTLSFPLLKAVTGFQFSINSCPLLDNPDLHSLKTFGRPMDQTQQTPTFNVYNNDTLTNLSRFHAIDCPDMNCNASIFNNIQLDNCDAQQLLTSFTNFYIVSWSGNAGGIPDAGVLCPDGSISVKQPIP